MMTRRTSGAFGWRYSSTSTIRPGLVLSKMPLRTSCSDALQPFKAPSPPGRFATPTTRCPPDPLAKHIAASARSASSLRRSRSAFLKSRFGPSRLCAVEPLITAPTADTTLAGTFIDFYYTVQLDTVVKVRERPAATEVTGWMATQILGRASTPPARPWPSVVRPTTAHTQPWSPRRRGRHTSRCR
jgi:hypothetical protein